jgi:hypothetical protein
MQLTNARVAAFEDGVLTLAFDQPGIEKGFLVAENDKVLADVLADMIGVRPRIATAVGRPEAAGTGLPVPSGSARPVPNNPADGARRESAGARSGAALPGRDDTPDPPAVDPAKPETRRAGTSRRQPRAGPAPRQAAGSEPEPGDHLEADTLTGSDLVARELGGRLIEEREEP